MEECVILDIPTLLYKDDDCKKKLFGFCQVDIANPMFLRGGKQSKDSLITDNVYFWTNGLDKNDYTLRGRQYSTIKKNGSKWVVEDKRSLQIKYSLERSTPFGVQLWLEHSTNKSLQLSFDSCKNIEFNCRDGLCVDLDKRCDGISDCLDASDEKECSYLNPSTIYDKSLPPLNKDHTGKKFLNLEIVHFSCLIYKIDDTDSTLQMQLGLILKWNDPRLAYKNLQVNQNNTTSHDHMDNIWIPELTVYYTTPGSFQEDPGSHSVNLWPRSAGTSSETDEVLKAVTHPGHEVDIVLSNWYMAEIICKFDNLHLFPFDYNSCSFRIIIEGTSVWEHKVEYNSVRFYLSSWNPIISSTDLGFYKIKDVIMDINDISGHAHVTVNTKRNFASIFMQYSLPTMLMSVVVYSSIFYYNDMFDIAMTVNITCLLAMSGFFTSLFISLPRSSGIKILDFIHLKGIFLSTTMTFLETFIVLKKPTAKKEAWTPDTKKTAVTAVDILLYAIPVLSFSVDCVFVTLGIMYTCEVPFELSSIW